ncbi:MAG: VWA domain-containing protein, partial [Anaerolineaceae bacterium]|nr:VWA domain-containing protein [Anaerolineaceae bacterium]
MSLLAMMLVSTSLAQESPGPRIEITGVNPGGLPRVGVMVNAFDNLGLPLANLSAENFRVVGELASHARVSSVVSFSDPEAVPISALLVIDVSTSMAGGPIRKAKEAAAAFVNSMAADDPVAVMTFSSRVNLIQDFTTDREITLAIIDGLIYGGKTLLYDASAQAIDLAAEVDNPRRAIILLSDGVHYDDQDRSTVSRAEVHRTAVVKGVPVYTIGLGFGADRSYLEQLSTETNAFFSESPSPQELNAIYTGLADLLRTQYDVTLEVNVPLDGRVWQLELEVDTPWGPVRSNGRLRAPVPVPIFSFPPVLQPIREPLEIGPDIVADDGIADVAAAIDDGATRTNRPARPAFTV